MANDTKERILKISLKLFAMRGYAGVSMSDIAKEIGITKAALYKHYNGKHEILDSIIKRMEEKDSENAELYGMPGTSACDVISCADALFADRIGEYSKKMFLYWTTDNFACLFRRLITIEQYTDKETAKLYKDYLSSGPYEYMAGIFKFITGSEIVAARLASEFYGTMFLFYSVFDGLSDKKEVIGKFNDFVDYFVKKIKREYFNQGEQKNGQ